MKKIYLILSALAFAATSFAQAVPNASFEAWRVTSSGGTTAKLVQAPTYWTGEDTLIIALGEYAHSFSLISTPDSAWKTQLFQDSGSANVHTGMYSARMVTAHQDTLGIFPGILSNAQTHIAITASGPGAPTFTGGTAVSSIIDTVSAWVKYTQGGTGDSGILTVSALKMIAGYDSVIGVGSVKIGPGTTFTQVFATVNYTASTLTPDTIRINFASSAGGAANAVGRTLWVDDVAMKTKVPSSVIEVNQGTNSVAVYPNPATSTLHFDAANNEEFTCALYAVNGQLISNKTITGSGTMDVSNIASGLYFYAITDKSGSVTQRGKVVVTKQ